MSGYLNKHKKVAKRFRILKKKFKKFFYYGCEVDEWMIELILMPFVSIKWKGEPTWYRTIGPPGSGKSAHLALLEGLEQAYFLDDLTPKSLVSGFRGNQEDPSKIQDLNDKVVVISDESTIMEQRQDDRNIIQSLLRRAYDGKVSKIFGNIKEKQEYHIKFNMLTGATPQIDRYFLYNQSLGERYMNYRMIIPDREKLAEVAFENQFTKDQEIYEELRYQVHNFIEKLPYAAITDIKITSEMRGKIIKVSNFISLIRTHIPRDHQGRNVTCVPQAESAGRLVKQITKTAIANAVVMGNIEITQENIKRAMYIGLGAITSVNAFILYNIYTFHKSKKGKKNDGWFSPQDLILQTGLGRGAVMNSLEDFSIYKVVDRRVPKKQGGRLFEYKLSKMTQDIIKETRLYESYVIPKYNTFGDRRKDRTNKDIKIKTDKSKKSKSKSKEKL